MVEENSNKIVEQIFRKQIVSDWYGNSPDLNPIENL